MTVQARQEPRAGAQSIYDANGEILLLGQWEPRVMFQAISRPDAEYWAGKRVLDIGANTFGLSIELARAGASVMAIEPDPFDWYFKLVERTVSGVIESEGIDLTIDKAGLFEAPSYGEFDVVLLLGVIYHFRDPQYLLDFLSTLEMRDLIISTQTHPGEELAIYNRKDASVLGASFWKKHREPMSGWHPTRPMFERMLQSAGFAQIEALTDPTVDFPKKPMPGLTNSAYYRARKMRTVDPDASRKIYYPR